MNAQSLITILMERHGFTQTSLAMTLGCQQGSISRYVAGYSRPSLKIALQLVKLAKRKKIPVKIEDLVNDEF